MSTENFKQSGKGPASSGQTHRIYRCNISADDASILIPAGCHWLGIQESAQALKYEIHTAARVVDADGSSIIDSAATIAAADIVPAREVTPGEYLNISHTDGTTNIGVVVLVMFGSGLPAGASNLTITDPGA